MTISTSMQIPILNAKRQYESIGVELEQAVLEVMRSGQYITAKYDKLLSEQFAQLCGTKFALPMGSGTEALHLALAALGVGPGDEVITSPFSFIATAEAISYLGATPVFVDIDPTTFNINPQLIEAKITPKTKVILPVHLYGLCADMQAIKAIAQKHNLKIVEDACQAVGAASPQGMAGSLGDMGCFSFYPTKNLGASGEGGIVTTNDEALYHKLKGLRAHGMYVRYYHEMIGYNARLDEIQCAVVSTKIKYLDKWNKRRQEIAQKILGALKNLPVKLPEVPAGYQHVFHQFTLRVKNRDEVVKQLTEKGIASGIYYPVPIHLQKAYAHFNFKVGLAPVAEQTANEVLSIPCYPELLDSEVDYMISVLKSVLAIA